MGARAQVIIRNRTYVPDDEGVALYTHYGSGSLPRTVAKALDAGRGRWGDTGYLTRRVFCTMLADGGEELHGELGYAIEPGRQVHGDLDYPPIVIDDGEQTVTHAGLTHGYDEFIAFQLSGAARQR